MEVISYIAILLGGIGVFMTGMNFLSKGLEKASGSGMKRILSKISNNRTIGFGIGVATTVLIQSSSATTVMAIGFVNAGAMSLFQASAIIIGANVGTTFTGFLVALSSINITTYLAILAAVGVFLKMLVKNERIKLLGEILLGIGLIFIGLDLMGSAFKNESVNSFLQQLFSSISFPLVLLLVGIIVTTVIQSSSAVTGIAIAMGVAGALKLEHAFFILLGANIGTCITGVLASIGTSTNAKRVALFQLLFNVFGVIVFLPLTWVYKDQMVNIFERLSTNISFQIAFYHLFFNIICSIMVLPFLKHAVNLVSIMVKDKNGLETELKLHNIDDLILKNPIIALEQTKKEIIRMAEITRINLIDSMDAILNYNIMKKDSIEKNELVINYLNKAISEYLIKLSSLISLKSFETSVGSYHHVINDLERIADHAINFLEVAIKLVNDNVQFSDQGVNEINIMYSYINQMFDLAINIYTNNNNKLLNAISDLEEKVDDYEKEVNSNYIERIRADFAMYENRPYFYTIISGLERIADHLTNIAYSIKSPTGDELIFGPSK